MGEGCKEKLDCTFLKYICTTYHSRKKKMRERLRTFNSMGPEKAVVMLMNKKEISAYFEGMNSVDN